MLAVRNFKFKFKKTTFEWLNYKNVLRNMSMFIKKTDT